MPGDPIIRYKNNKSGAVKTAEELKAKGVSDKQIQSWIEGGIITKVDDATATSGAVKKKDGSTDGPSPSSNIFPGGSSSGNWFNSDYKVPEASSETKPADQQQSRPGEQQQPADQQQPPTTDPVPGGNDIGPAGKALGGALQSVKPVPELTLEQKIHFDVIANTDAAKLITDYAQKQDEFEKNKSPFYEKAAWDKITEHNKYLQSREGKAGLILSDILNGDANTEDVRYLATAAPKALQQVLKAVDPEATLDLKSPEAVASMVGKINQFATEKSAQKKAESFAAQDSVVKSELSNIQIDPKKISQSDEYIQSVLSKIDGQKKSEIDALNKAYPVITEKNIGTPTNPYFIPLIGGFARERVNQKEYDAKLDEINSKYDDPRRMVGLSKAFDYAKANPNEAPITIGLEYLKYADKDKYTLRQKAGGSAVFDRDVAQLGVNALYASGDPGAMKMAIEDEKTLDNIYPDKIIAETYHRLGAEMAKSSNFLINDYSVIKQVEAADQLPKKYKDVYYKNILPLESSYFMRTDVPQTGLLNKTWEGFAGTADETAKFFGDITGLRSEQDQAKETVNQLYNTHFTNVGQYPDAVARLKELKTKEKKAPLSVEEKAEKADLETFTNVRSTFREIIDGTGNVTGQVLFQALATKGLAAPITAGLEGAGLVRTGIALEGLSTEEAIASTATDFGISKNLVTALSADAIAYASSYDSGKRDALQLFPDDKDAFKRKAYASYVAFINAATERIFKDEKVLNAFNKEIRPDIVKLVNKLSTGEIKNEAIGATVKSFLTKSATFGKAALKANLEESFEEFASSAGQSLADYITAPAKFNDRQAFDNAISSFTTMFTGGGIISLMAGKASVNQNYAGLPLLSQLGVNERFTSDVKFRINELLLNKQISQAEADEKMRIVNTAAKINTSVMPDVDQVKKLNERARQKYSVLLLNEKILEAKIRDAKSSDTHDEVMEKNYQQQIKESQNLRQGILDTKLVVDDDYSVKDDKDLAAVKPGEEDQVLEDLNSQYRQNIAAIGGRQDINDTEKEALKEAEDKRHAEELKNYNENPEEFSSSKIDNNGNVQQKEGEGNGTPGQQDRSASAQNDGSQQQQDQQQGTDGSQEVLTNAPEKSTEGTGEKQPGSFISPKPMLNNSVKDLNHDYEEFYYGEQDKIDEKNKEVQKLEKSLKGKKGDERVAIQSKIADATDELNGLQKNQDDNVNSYFKGLDNIIKDEATAQGVTLTKPQSEKLLDNISGELFEPAGREANWNNKTSEVIKDAVGRFIEDNNIKPAETEKPYKIISFKNGTLKYELNGEVKTLLHNTKQEAIDYLDRKLAKKESRGGYAGTEISSDVIQREMRPYAESMADIEQKFSEKGYNIDWDYDNETSVVDKKTGDFVDPENLPDDLKPLAAKYEKATQSLADYDYDSYQNILKEAREKVKGEEVQAEVTTKQPPAIKGTISTEEKDRTENGEFIAEAVLDRVNSSLAALNDGRKGKEVYKFATADRLGDYLYVTALNGKGDLVANVYDKEGNLPERGTANWRNPLIARKDLNYHTGKDLGLSNEQKPAAKKETAPVDTKKAEILKKLEEKKKAFQQALKDSRGKLTVGVDPTVIAKGIDMLATYAELGIHNFSEVVKDMVQTFGNLLSREDIDAMKGVYAYQRSNLPKDQRASMQTEDQVDDFMEKDLPAIMQGDNSDPKQNLINEAITYAKDIKTKAYRDAFIETPEQSLKEIAEQINAGHEKTVERIFGQNLLSIAKNLFPDVDFKTDTTSDQIRALSSEISQLSNINTREASDRVKELIQQRTALEVKQLHEKDVTSNPPVSDTVLPDTSKLPEGTQPGVSPETIPAKKAEGTPGNNSGEGQQPVSSGDQQGQKRGGSKRNSKRNDTGTSGESGTEAARGSETHAAAGVQQDKGLPDELKPVPETDSDRNHVIAAGDVIVPTGNVAKFNANMNAIILLRQLQKEERNPTPEEKKSLAQFVGWGGLADYLDDTIDQEMVKLVRSVVSGGEHIYGRGDNKINFPGVDFAGKTFDQVAKQIQSQVNAAIKSNKDLAYILPYEYDKGNVSLDEIRKMMIPSMMSEEEFSSAQQSTINAHYTARPVIEQMWSMMKRLGFSGGNVLESSMGVGHFFGLMPQDMAGKSSLTGYELDSITGGIAKLLYPQANVQVKGFQYSMIPKNSVDLAIGNVPFGEKGLVRDFYNDDLTEFNLHNYFIAKNIRLLRPGGIAALISSSSTMDKPGSAKFRDWVNNLKDGNTDFIGAIRLPNNAFESNAGTQVTTDILVFQKRMQAISAEKESWRNLGTDRTVPYKNKEGEIEDIDININEYYLRHPENMIGKMQLAFESGTGGLYDETNQTLVADKNTDITKRLGELVNTFPENVFEKAATYVHPLETIDSDAKDGLLVKKNNKVYVSTGETATEADLKASQVKTALAYVDVRDKLSGLVNMEMDENATEENIEAAREEFNKQYDDFVKKHGTFTKNNFLNDVDIDYPLAASVENVDKQTIPESGKKVVVVSKGEIFSKRINFPRTEPKVAENLRDAISISTAYRNHVNPEYIASLIGSTVPEVQKQMLDQQLAYINPDNGLFETKEDYLSGNVRKKLDAAERMAAEDHTFRSNVDALKNVIPDDIPASVISFSMGVSWLPSNIYKDFVKEHFGVSVGIDYLPVVGRWQVGKRGAQGVHDARNTTTYGAGGQTALELFEDSMNNRQTVITYTEKVGTSKVTKTDVVKTAEAQNKQNEINDLFTSYVRNHPQYRETLEGNYNDKFNGHVSRQFDLPPFEYFPGAAHIVKLREHQRKAVLRNIAENTLDAHSVGSGKTYTIITTAMEMRRLGIARKPVIAVHNATRGQFVTSFRKLYPAAKLLVPSDKEMAAEGRQKLFGRIATGDWDAVVIPQSQLDMIPDSPERIKTYLLEQIDELRMTIDLLEGADGREKYRMQKEIEGLQDEIDAIDSGESTGGRKTGGKKRAKEMGGKIARATASVEKQASRRVDNIINFDQMNIDALLVDEAHAYKRLGFQTNLKNIKGIDTSKSKRSLSVLFKTQSVMEKTGGKNVNFFTGTPITNTMAEVWTMMRYLAPNTLSEMGITYFDQFAQTFGDIVPSLEQTGGGTYKVVNRFAKFKNLPELIQAFRNFADVVTNDDVKEFAENKDLPQLNDGKITQTVVPLSDGLRDMIQSFRQTLLQWQELPGKEKMLLRHIPLLIFNRAKQAAIDLRLINPSAKDEPESKVNKTIKNVMKLYNDFNGYKAVQMIFADKFNSPEVNNRFLDDDNQIPNPAYGKQRFNLYVDIKNKLMDQGIPESEIAILTDPKFDKKENKEQLFTDANAGKIRIMMGSTERMGVGVNAQERLIAVHHIDAPDRPDQFEQRNGRMIRQGNMFAKLNQPVNSFAYGVEKTMDSTAFQRLMLKQNFINQIMKGEVNVREMEDPAAESDPTFEEMMASLSDSQYAMKKVMVDKQLRDEKMKKESFQSKQIEVKYKTENAIRRLAEQKQGLKIAKDVAPIKKKHFPDNKIESVEIDGVLHQEKITDAIDKRIKSLTQDAFEKGKAVANISVNNVPAILAMEYRDISKDVYGKVVMPMLNIEKDVPTPSAQGYLTNIRNEISSMDSDIPYYEKEIEAQTQNIANYKLESEKRFDDTKLNELDKESKDLQAKILDESSKKEAEMKAKREQAEKGKKEGKENGTAQNDDLDSLIEQAKKDLTAGSNELLSSIIPIPPNLKKYIKLGFLYLRKGVKTVSEFAKAIGAKINKVLNAAWNKAKEYFSDYKKTGTVPPAMAAATGGTTSSSTPPTGTTTTTPTTPMAKIAQMRKDAQANAERMMKELEEKVFGNITTTDADYTKKPSLLNKILNVPNKVQDNTFGRMSDAAGKKIGQAASKGMESKNYLVRNTSKLLNSVFANLGKSTEDILASEKFTGESRVRAVSDAVKISETLREILDKNEGSLNRINRVIDPEFFKELTYDDFIKAIESEIDDPVKFGAIPPAKLKDRYNSYREVMGFDDPDFKDVKYDDLTPEEKKVHDIIRFMYDTMHEINFSIGKLTPETYEKNKGNYSARLYDKFEIPEEAREHLKSSPIKIDESLYMEKGDINEWKLLNRLGDPIYASTKRLYQTMVNKAIIDYADYIVKNKPDAFETKETKGFRRLGWGYGAISNKWVRDDVAEDFIGFFYADAMMQKFYDFTKKYDRLAVRQFYKKLYTVYTPGTHVGNIMGNNIFGMILGVNPIRLNANVPWAIKQAKDYTGDYRYLMSNGLISTDFTKEDLVESINKLEEMADRGSKSKNPLKYAQEKLQNFYSATDDVYKMAAFKSLVDKGYKPSEALNMVKEGFQNYKRVGKSYDLFSKTPLVGNPFGKFSGDLARIVKNGLTRHPLNTIVFLASLRFLSQYFSYMSGEDDQKRKIRERRAGMAKIPLPEWAGGDVPLSWKVGDKEVNVARLLSPLFVYGSSDGDDSYQIYAKLAPLQLDFVDWTQNPNGRVAANIAKNSRDPVLGPLVQLMVNSDFRGVPIADPKETKFKPSLLTGEERTGNSLRFLMRSYVPYGATGDDIVQSIGGNPDYYGRQRSVGNIMLNFLGGVKIVDFPETRYGVLLKQKMDGYGYRFAQEARVIHTLNKQLKEGQIKIGTYNDRIAPHIENQAVIVKDAQEEYFKLTGQRGGIDLSKQDVILDSEMKPGTPPQMQLPKIDIPKVNPMQQ